LNRAAARAIALQMEPQRVAAAARSILRLRAGEPPRPDEDTLAVEEPLEIRIGGRPTTVIMRTPGADEELARGFLFTEGLIARAEELRALARPDGLRAEERGNVLDVQVAAPALVRVTPQALQRNFYASSSCGVCGKSSLAAIEVRSPPVSSQLTVERALLAALPARLSAAQPTFARTGGLHAAALFDERGALLAAREDVGRHNAVDKLIGWALVEGRLPASRAILMVSGRTSFEILQKAIAAGVPVVCAVSAPSSLAVELADRFGVTLIGFLREGPGGASMNVYAHPERITDSAAP
jgi:FdhD protein